MSHRHSPTIQRLAVLAGALLSLCALDARAGSLDAPAAPSSASSAMYTVTDVYNHIDNGTAGTQRSTFAEPTAAPGATGYTLNQLYDLASQRSRPAQTGQTTCYDTSGNLIDCTGTGQDGAWQKGVTPPSPRFTDNGNGTVTDNLTGLIWLKNANCFGPQNWATALNSANSLSNGTCNLTDGSMAGAWHLPNFNELRSLMNYGYSYPALSNAAGTGQWSEGDAFSNVQSDYYWSSTTHHPGANMAWLQRGDGFNPAGYKWDAYYVWPVRGGQ